MKLSSAKDNDGHGKVVTYQPNGKTLVVLGSNSNGAVTTRQPNGKILVGLGANSNGGVVGVFNKTGEYVIQLLADEYGNGDVGLYNRKGKGRELKPGP